MPPTIADYYRFKIAEKRTGHPIPRATTYYQAIN